MVKVVIKIPNEVYSDIQKGIIRKHIDKVYVAIAKGTPLPKGHGRLIDADALKTTRTMALVAEKNAPQNEIAFAPLVCVLKEKIDDAPTIVEADKESEDATSN